MFTNFPNDLLHKILLNCPLSDIDSINRSSKKNRESLHCQRFWKSKYQQKFGFVEEKTSDLDYLHEFKSDYCLEKRWMKGKWDSWPLFRAKDHICLAINGSMIVDAPLSQSYIRQWDLEHGQVENYLDIQCSIMEFCSKNIVNWGNRDGQYGWKDLRDQEKRVLQWDDSVSALDCQREGFGFVIGGEGGRLDVFDERMMKNPIHSLREQRTITSITQTKTKIFYASIDGFLITIDRFTGESMKEKINGIINVLWISEKCTNLFSEILCLGLDDGRLILVNVNEKKSKLDTLKNKMIVYESGNSITTICGNRHSIISGHLNGSLLSWPIKAFEDSKAWSSKIGDDCAVWQICCDRDKIIASSLGGHSKIFQF